MRTMTSQVAFGRRWAGWGPVARASAALIVVVSLLGLAAINVLVRATWHEVEDGVLWASATEGVMAAAVAPGTAAERAGLRVGDVLLAIDGLPVDTLDDVVRALHGGRRGTELTYSIVRLGLQDVRTVTLASIPAGHRNLYFILVGVAVFSLLVGAAVRLRRPSDPATLHFFWLTVAFFGALAFSYSGRFDRLDWMFYWSDVVALLALAPLFMHFSLVFPERTPGWARTTLGASFVPLVYLPALVLGGARVLAVAGRLGDVNLTAVVELLDRLELAYLGACLLAGLFVMVRALRRVRSLTSRRQLRWIMWGTALGGLPFTAGYIVPFAFGFNPLPRMELTAIPLGLVPLAFASAIVRYRLMDVEVIVKRALVYAAAVAAILAIYGVFVQLARTVFLGGSEGHNSVIAVLATLVVVLLAHPVKNGIQTILDRAYYRDRYDYRRALVGFARDLNSDLDLQRLSERLVTRVVETLVIDRMALMLPPAEGDPAADFTVVAARGFEESVAVPVLERASGLGMRLLAGHRVVLEDPVAARRFSVEELAFWRQHGVHSFVPCVAKEGTIAVMALGRRVSGEPLSSEDMSLLAAVAGQVATALENARLYRQLGLKASEIDRMHVFSENIIESLHDGLVVIDLDERIRRWNRRLESLYGLEREQVTGAKLDTVFDAAFVDALRGARSESPSGASLLRVPLLSRHAEAPRRLLVNAAIVPLRTAEGTTAGAMILIENITARVQLEEQLQISEKMASIGLLAAGVAHEVNTPLTGISSFTQMLLQSVEPDDPKARLLEKIERQTFRAAKIVNGLLNLARPVRVEAGAIDINAVVNDVLGLIEHQLKSSHIKVRKELASQAPVVRGIEFKLQQVFLNLFLNARDAMPKGGWLSIATSATDGEATIEISDTGAGIPAEHLSRIYDPFFTTKDMGRGTGLGLSITYGIIQEHDGRIACESKVGQGTRFTLTLPLAVMRRERQGEVAR